MNIEELDISLKICFSKIGYNQNYQEIISNA